MDKKELILYSQFNKINEKCDNWHASQNLIKRYSAFSENPIFLKDQNIKIYNCFPNFLLIAIFVIIIYIFYVLKIRFCNIFKDAYHYLFYVLLNNMYSTVTTKHFILKLILFPAKIWHVILHLVTPPLVVMTAWIVFGITECMASSSCEFKVHHI